MQRDRTIKGHHVIGFTARVSRLLIACEPYYCTRVAEKRGNSAGDSSLL
jgi:hypothetical protein